MMVHLLPEDEDVVIEARSLWPLWSDCPHIPELVESLGLSYCDICHQADEDASFLYDGEDQV